MNARTALVLCFGNHILERENENIIISKLSPCSIARLALLFSSAHIKWINSVWNCMREIRTRKEFFCFYHCQRIREQILRQEHAKLHHKWTEAIESSVPSFSILYLLIQLLMWWMLCSFHKKPTKNIANEEFTLSVVFSDRRNKQQS